MANKRVNTSAKKTASFEEMVRRSVGPKKWKSLPSEDRQVVGEMSKIQEKGRPVGSAAFVKKYDNETPR